MKKYRILSLMFAIIILSTQFVFAASVDNNYKIRVGIYFGSNTRYSYNVAGSGLFVIADGRVVHTTSASQMTVSRTGTVYYSSESYGTYAEANKNGLVLYANGGFHAASVSSQSGYSRSNSANIQISTNDGTKLVIQGGVDQYIESGDGIIRLEGKPYRERLNFFNNGSKLIAINVLGMDNYLKGVVASEMPPSWHLEALKAQAVVARNYAVTNAYKHSAEGFHICNTTHCQVYGGVNSENPRTSLAVEQTSGEIMYYANKPVEGYFHSSSGGRTENSENIWGSSKPYLRGVDDPFSLGGPHDNWVVVMSSSDIRTRLYQSGVNIGEVIGMSVDQTSGNGRVLSLTVIGTNGTHTIKKERIRTFLGSSKFKSLFFTVTGGTQVSGESVTHNAKGTSLQQSGKKVYTTNEYVAPQFENVSASSSEINVPSIDKNSMDSIYNALGYVLQKHTLPKNEDNSKTEQSNSKNNQPKQNNPSDKKQNQTQNNQQENNQQQNNQPSQVAQPQYQVPYQQPQAVQNQPRRVIGSTYVFYGKGYGHGIGMSQYGAKGMAERGYNHYQILGYYFNGVVIAR